MKNNKKIFDRMCLMQCKLLSLILSLVVCITFDSSFSMEKTEENNQPGIHKTETKVSYVTARERLNFVKECYESIDKLTMTTPIANLYDKFYRKDYAFIKKQLSNRDSSQVVIAELAEFDRWVKSRFYNKESNSWSLSFFDYNFIAKVWVTLLNMPLESKAKSIELEKEEYEYVLEKYLKDGYVANGFHKLNFISAPGIIIPHVSPSGGVPIPVINEGFGFKVDENLVGRVSFLAVGTNPQLTFDYLKDQTAFYNWFHDYEHAERSEHFDDHRTFIWHTTKIAQLRAKINSISDVTLKQQAELAFFMLFHESQTSVKKITETLKRRIAYTEEILSQKDIVPTTGFDSIEQYQTYIKGAESLKLDLGDGDTIAKYRRFLEHKLSGYKFLLQQAGEFDS
ncbi:MAG TPA: hypothetical protein VNJ29_02785 [Candidatus Nitrosotenuis sp.]|jgi:hypothetical protein|nr:hypothetical protein [Candidatus Nitrosotenuis sp.]